LHFPSHAPACNPYNWCAPTCTPYIPLLIACNSTAGLQLVVCRIRRESCRKAIVEPSVAMKPPHRVTGCRRPGVAAQTVVIAFTLLHIGATVEPKGGFGRSISRDPPFRVTDLHTNTNKHDSFNSPQNTTYESTSHKKIFI
jgi:hypothetical protein